MNYLDFDMSPKIPSFIWYNACPQTDHMASLMRSARHNMHNMLCDMMIIVSKGWGVIESYLKKDKYKPL